MHVQHILSDLAMKKTLGPFFLFCFFKKSRCQLMVKDQIRIKSLDPLRAKKIFISKAEDGPYLGFSYKSLFSDTIRSGKRSQRKIL